jgi:tetratricopeptide (TPR) repeat protein
LNQESRDISNLLKFLSFLDPESISLDMIVDGAKVWLQNQPTQAPSHPIRTISQKVKESDQKQIRGFGNAERQVDTINDESCVSSEFHSLVTLILSPTKFRTAIQMLQNLSLVEHQSNMGKSTLRMHDLVQFMMQEGARKEENYGKWLQSSVSFICLASRQIKYPEWPQWWDECEKFTPHLRSLNERLDTINITTTNLELGRANWWLAGYLRGRGRYDEAEALYKKALGELEKQLGDGDADTLSTMNDLALVYQEQGRSNEAEVLYKRALSGMTERLGGNHPYTRAIMDNLGKVYQSQGRYEDAEELLKRALAGWEKYLGVDHADTLVSVNNLALVYMSQKRYAEAETLYKRALSGNEKVLGDDHPHTLMVVGNLGEVYRLQGRFDDAERLFQRQLTGREKQIGINHPDTLTAVNDLALVCESQGRYVEAEGLYKRALSGIEEQFGCNHPKALTIASNLARVYRAQGRSDDADALSTTRRRPDAGGQ